MGSDCPDFDLGRDRRRGYGDEDQRVDEGRAGSRRDAFSGAYGRIDDNLDGMLSLSVAAFLFFQPPGADSQLAGGFIGS